MKYLIYIVIFLFLTNCNGFIDNLFETKDEKTIKKLTNQNWGLQDSVSFLVNDIFWAIDYIDSLEYELSLEKKKVKIVEKEVVKNIVDTLVITQGGFDVNTLYRIDFKEVSYQNGSALRVYGQTNFKWDFINNKPIEIRTSIDDYNLNMNIVTKIEPHSDKLILHTRATTPSIKITSHVNNVLTEDDYLKKIPTKFGVGLVGGFGFSYQGMTPYVGIGITYSFYDIGNLLKK